MNTALGSAPQTYVTDSRSVSGDSAATVLFSRTHDFAFSDRVGRLVTRQVQLGIGSLRVARVASTGHRITLSEDANATVLLPRVGALALSIAGRHHDLCSGSAALMPPQQRQTRAGAQAHLAFMGDVLLVPMAGLADLARRIGAADPGARDLTLLEGPAASRLARAVGAIVTCLSPMDSPSPQGRIDALAHLLCDCLAETIATPGELQSRGREHARVRRAEAYLHAHVADPVSTADLAQELDISLRCLQLAFQHMTGRSPRAYLTEIRLDLAHAGLLVADPDQHSVTDIAFDCGFTHLGRFAGAYARRFGQPPSRTLAARPPRVARRPRRCG